jgi:hypothetical protein
MGESLFPSLLSFLPHSSAIDDTGEVIGALLIKTGLASDNTATTSSAGKKARCKRLWISAVMEIPARG